MRDVSRCVLCAVGAQSVSSPNPTSNAVLVGIPELMHSARMFSLSESECVLERVCECSRDRVSTSSSFLSLGSSSPSTSDSSCSCFCVWNLGMLEQGIWSPLCDPREAALDPSLAVFSLLSLPSPRRRSLGTTSTVRGSSSSMVSEESEVARENSTGVPSSTQALGASLNTPVLVLGSEV